MRNAGKQIGIRAAFALVLASASVQGASAQNATGQSILEQMQVEVAAIVRNAKPAIVTIEDRGPLRLTIIKDNKDNGEKQQQADQVATLRAHVQAAAAQMQAAQASLDAANKQFANGAVPRAAVTQRQSELANAQRTLIEARENLLRMEANGQKPQNNQNAARALAGQDVADAQIQFAREQLAEAQRQIQPLIRELADMRPRYTAENPRVVETQKALADARRTVTEAQAVLQKAYTQRLSAMQNLNAMRVITPATPKTGTGFSIGDGYIVTTSDVLDGMKEPITVTLDNGERTKASLVGMDKQQNIGLVRVTVNTAAALPFGDSDQLAPGHFVISIGNQSGMANSVALNLVAGMRTQGVETAAHFFPQLIQIAGTVGAGTSGAPLLNPRGEVVGIIVGAPVGDTVEAPLLETAIPDSPLPVTPRMDTRQPPGVYMDAETGQPYTIFPKATPNGVGSQNDGNAGQSRQSGGGRRFILSRPTYVRPPVTSAGYAIPINAVRATIDALRNGKTIAHGWLGVTLADNTPEIRENNGLPQKVFIYALYPKSPAAKAGLWWGDGLLAINGTPIENSLQARSLLANLKPGETLRLKVHFGDGTRDVSVPIEARPDPLPPLVTNGGPNEKEPR